MWNPKVILLTSAVLALGAMSARADYLDSNGIVRNDGGNIRYMSHYDAKKACPAGTHLPTIRELALVAQAAGAEGIVEWYETGTGDAPGLEITAYYGDEPINLFYFRKHGYKAPVGDLGKNRFWSASRYMTDLNKAYYFNAFTAGLIFYPRSAKQAAVRCFLDGRSH